MCESSIHVKNRRATARERLVLRNVRGGHMGFYPAHSRAENPALVCIREVTEITLTGIKVQPQFVSGGNKGMAKMFAAVAKLDGETVKARFAPGNAQLMPADSATIVGWSDFLYADSVVVNNYRIPLYFLEAGMRAEIGERPARKPRGMKVVEASINEALAMPDPPEGGEADAPAATPPATPPAEPAKEPMPAEGEPTKARRRL